MVVATAGQIEVNRHLPEKLRNYSRTLDKKGIQSLFDEVARNYPNQYKDILTGLKNIGSHVAYVNGSSFTLDDFKSVIPKEQIIDDFVKQMPSNISSRDLALGFSKLQKEIEDKTLAEAFKRGNNLAIQVKSGTRGTPSNLASTIGSPVMYADHMSRPIPIPIRHSFSEGLDPVEYWASTYGTRRGVIATKFATPEGGFFNKQVGYTTGSMLVAEPNCGTTAGIEASADDSDNLGRHLAKGVLHYPAGTMITKAVINDLAQAKVKNVIIRSPITCATANGLCQHCRGLTEQGRLAEVGENVGLNSSAALTEPFTQSSMKEKHTGGVLSAKAAYGGLDLIRQLLKVPQVFKFGATTAQHDGKVNSIEAAGHGGYNVMIGKTKHYVGPDYELKVKVGDDVEAAQPLSDGIINPAEVTVHRGIGEGRRQLFDSLRTAYQNDGKGFINKVHMETLARSMVDLARVSDNQFLDDHLPGDIVPTNTLAQYYHPDNVVMTHPTKATGKYLAKPYLHYTVGSPFKPSMATKLLEHGYDNIAVTNEEPPFHAVMVRMDEVPAYKTNWLARLYSSQLKKKLLQATHAADSAPLHSEEFIPSYIYAKEFGKPKIGY